MPLWRTTVALTFPTGSRAGTNTWHVRTVTDDDSELDTVMGMIQAYYGDIATALWHADYTARWDGSASEVDSESPAFKQTNGDWLVTGPDSGASPAAGVGVVVTWRSSLASRRGRGRTFHCPVREDAFDDNGTIEDGTLADVRDASDALVSASTVSTLGSVVVYSESDHVGRDIVGRLVNDRVAYLSSRRS